MARGAKGSMEGMARGIQASMEGMARGIQGSMVGSANVRFELVCPAARRCDSPRWTLKESHPRRFGRPRPAQMARSAARQPVAHAGALAAALAGAALAAAALAAAARRRRARRGGAAIVSRWGV